MPSLPDIDFITVDEACRIIGGSRPISRATYYRGIKAQRFPAVEHPSPGISRVRRWRLLEAINEGSTVIPSHGKSAPEKQ